MVGERLLRLLWLWGAVAMVGVAGADQRGADLRGADLADENLAGANLSVADLSGANLQGADLTGATLVKTTLVRANLRGGRPVTCNPALRNVAVCGPDRRERIFLPICAGRNWSGRG